MEFLPFDITIDFSPIEAFMAQSPEKIIYQVIFHYGGWVVFAAMTLWFLGKFAWLKWVESRQIKFVSKKHYVMLAIDVPKENEQGPEAVELLFIQLAGAHSPENRVSMYWRGEIQPQFSFELVSNDGYTQYYVRTEARFRDMIEAMIFAQYPEAEISEVEDYIDQVPDDAPNEDYDLWGSEFVYVNKSAYPIKTYDSFGRGMPGMVMEFKDPMAALLETMGKVRKGENLWLQIMVYPAGPFWWKNHTGVIKEIQGIKEAPKKGRLAKILALPAGFISEVMGIFFRPAPAPEKPEEKKKDLTAVERKILEAVEKKLSKIAFATKIRMIYGGKRTIFNKGVGVNGFIGAIKQFNALNMNALKPDKMTKTYGGEIFKKIRKRWRQKAVLKNYKAREMGLGPNPFYMNAEELATLWHFPVLEVKAPTIRKAEARKAEPPVGLPMYEENKPSDAGYRPPVAMPEQPVAKSEPPADLPIIEE